MVHGCQLPPNMGTPDKIQLPALNLDGNSENGVKYFSDCNLYQDNTSAAELVCTSIKIILDLAA